MKCLAMVFVFVLAIGLVCAVGDWGDINDGNGSDDAADPVVNDSGSSILDILNDSDNEDGDVVGDYVAPDYSGSDGDSFEYTDNFYIALGLGAIAVLIIIYFIYLFFRKPRNQWKPRK